MVTRARVADRSTPASAPESSHPPPPPKSKRPSTRSSTASPPATSPNASSPTTPKAYANGSASQPASGPKPPTTPHDAAAQSAASTHEHRLRDRVRKQRVLRPPGTQGQAARAHPAAGMKATLGSPGALTPAGRGRQRHG